MALTTADTLLASGLLARPDDPAAAADGFARLIELRDGRMARHAERVTRLALALAGRVGIASEAVPVLRTAARMHDVGMIGVPDRILLKDGPLDRDEWSVIRCHPEWGTEALAAVPGLEDAASVVLFHHERWDGRGYPDGLAGADIPLESRILAVCDAYCAMTAQRPYRTALSPADASTLVRSAAGRQFDPAVAGALLAVVGGPGELAQRRHDRSV
ncbi:MAG TPA: HD-GYP domain-containing protein [Solirubrobacteraceae bacterium]|jgi:HD-GYP domain-containing protein (c-di-GMP phosphodiesterase class II)|nr:HD-GYP domain-containing protein [Solirubrobacteraceae bacterium]